VPKLHGSFRTPIGHEGNTTIVAVRVADVEREDGTLAQIKGDLRAAEHRRVIFAPCVTTRLAEPLEAAN
jgi:hypothetical protein